MSRAAYKTSNAQDQKNRFVALIVKQNLNHNRSAENMSQKSMDCIHKGREHELQKSQVDAKMEWSK